MAYIWCLRRWDGVRCQGSAYRERPGPETGLGAPHSERSRRGARTSCRDQEGMAREVGKSQQPAWKRSRQSASGGGSARLSNAAGRTSGSRTKNGRAGFSHAKATGDVDRSTFDEVLGVKTRLEWA